jgi:hypothetical protein
MLNEMSHIPPERKGHWSIMVHSNYSTMGRTHFIIYVMNGGVVAVVLSMDLYTSRI